MREKKDINEEVFRVASEVFHLPCKLLKTASAPNETPGWDSLAHLTFIVALETVFDVTFSTADIMAIQSIGDAQKLIRQKVAQ